ncbi:glycosyltransferase family 2 protein [Pseudarthrobacter sp. NamB4]|uniref:glycosyltransferase n=1 Tax=Pseudarthrobacter sp. NamB4 TaxID=2576837 RepID=UPI0014850DB4|nr:glycosyltransferase family 2 protein [Pseudarthrobacter sp. NamB4]
MSAVPHDQPLDEPLDQPAEYILPLRWTDDADLPELVAYLRHLTGWIAVTVVDGSPPALFERHRALFPPAVRHIRPEAGTEPGREPGPAPRGGNGKVAGVMTGVRAASAELLVIADDDVRYTRESLAAVVHHLGWAEVVRPQNYFDSLPWHAWWDTSRTLINRAWSDDFPGTLGVRRSALLATGGYDPVLFENLELIRTIKAAGGRERILPDLFVARRPPKARHFLKQRVRQAYDNFAQPRRLAVELALLPLLVGAACLPARHRRNALLGLAAAPAVAAEVGRRRHNGTAVFPLGAVPFAPLWALERAVCMWIALGYRLAGGVPYAGTRLKTAAHPQAELRRRHHGKLAGTGQRDEQVSTSTTEQEQA